MSHEVLQLTQGEGKINCFLEQFMPDDILIGIFEFCVDEGGITYQDDGDLERSSASLFPLNVPLVCRRWRQIAISHPHLWAAFSICYSSGVKDVSCIHSFLDVILPRSGNAPLCIRFSYMCRDVGDEETHLFQRIMNTHHRWQRMYLEATAGWARASSTLKNVRLSDMPYLEDLRWDNKWGFMDSKHDGSGGVFDVSASPRLISLDVVGKYQIIMNREESFHTDIRKFRYEPDGHDHWPRNQWSFPVVLSCRPLASFVFRVHNPDSFIPFSDDDVVRAFELPSLHQVEITGCSVGTLSLLDTITAPNLRELLLRTTGMNDSQSISTITRFLTRMTPHSLSSLHLEYDSDENSLDTYKSELAILRLVPALESLKLALTIIRSEVIDSLTLSPSTESLCPQIRYPFLQDEGEYLRIGAEGVLDRTRSIAKLITSRWNIGDRRLNCIEVLLGIDRDSEAWAPVRSLLDQGCHVQLEVDSDSDQSY